jgi:hypothetical protein
MFFIYSFFSPIPSSKLAVLNLLLFPVPVFTFFARSRVFYFLAGLISSSPGLPSLFFPFCPFCLPRPFVCPTRLSIY